MPPSLDSSTRNRILQVRKPATHNRIICPSFPVYCLRQYSPSPTQRTTPAAVDETPTPESEPTYSSDHDAGGGRRGCGLGSRPRARGFALGWRRRPGPASILEEPSRWWTKYAVVWQGLVNKSNNHIFNDFTSFRPLFLYKRVLIEIACPPLSLSWLHHGPEPKKHSKNSHLIIHFPQYLRLDSWLFWTIVDRIHRLFRSLYPSLYSHSFCLFGFFHSISLSHLVSYFKYSYQS